jgi:hypothetical protein
MPQKIFISYRREDSAANALGIGQYLENEFGRKNVFIDIDMRAGTKFPVMLEQRLAECKVMLVLIGPDWLNSRDGQGQRRLDNPDDWVRLEIAHALKRDITVIPVRVNGVDLPPKTTLPEEIRGLLDHQAVSVSTSSFRSDMAGLAKDVRSIPSPWPWRRFGAVATGLLLPLLVGLALAYNFGLTSPEGIRRLTFSTSPQAPVQKGMWSSRPGEWVLYGYTDKWVGYYLQPSSVKRFANAVVYTARIPTKSSTSPSSSEKAVPESAYEDQTTVIDCQKTTFLMAERTVYSESGEIIFHYKFGDPEKMNLSAASWINPNTVLWSAATLLCDEQLSTPLLSKNQVAKQISEMKLSFLMPSPNGDGSVLYGPIRTVSNRDYQFEGLMIFNQSYDHSASELLSGNNIIGLPLTFRVAAQTVQAFCKDTKARAAKIEYYDAEGNLMAALVPVLDPLQPNPASPFEAFINVACGLSVAGTYEGMNNATYERGGQAEQKISITIEQVSSDLNVVFQTANGAQGKGSGKLTGTRVESMSLESTTPECPGSYKGSMEFPGDTVTWSYKGEDCGGAMEGHGAAKKVKF